jgi:hypothetical protein
VLRQSISDGSFTLKRHESVSPKRHSICHPVFDSSSLKRTDAHPKPQRPASSSSGTSNTFSKTSR